MKQFMNFIGGEFVAGAKTFENRAPVDNRLIGLVHEAGAARSMPPCARPAPRSTASGAA